MLQPGPCGRGRKELETANSGAQRTPSSMWVKSVQLGLSRCAGRAAMTESPRGQGRTTSTEAR
eukprot:7724701-Alexandrium_andersonii.AAC.1